MPIRAALTHVTHYQYGHPVQLAPQLVRLRPAPHYRGRLVSYSMDIEPAGHFIHWQQDPYANFQARLVFPERTSVFKVTVSLEVEAPAFNPFDFFLEPGAEVFPFRYSAELAQALTLYLAPEAGGAHVDAYLETLDRRHCSTIDFLVAVNRQVKQDVKYLVREEPGVQSPDETLRAGSGSCRDSGWLLVQLLRHCGLAARFVSGYFVQLAPATSVNPVFNDLHAWCEVYLPGAGWIGLDPTSGLLVGEGYIPLACTPSPAGAAPVEGLVDKADVVFSHRLDVVRL